MSELGSDLARRQAGDGTDLQRCTGIAIQPLDAQHARQTAALLDDLRVSLFGIQSARLYATLAADALLRCAGRSLLHRAATGSRRC